MITAPTPHRDTLNAHLVHLAARIARLELEHAGQHAAHRLDAACLQVALSHLAPPVPLGTALAGSAPAPVRGPEWPAASSRGHRARWPRYRAG
jgi:hypothetical protein